MSEHRYNLDDVEWPTTTFDLRSHSIIIGKRGSEAHGTWQPPTDPTSIDDRDLMCIVVPPLDSYFGLHAWDSAESIKGCWDVVAYEAKKFINLLVKQNPNVLSLLWLRDEDYLHLTDEGRILVEHRTLFRSKAAFMSFSGYANGQLSRMTHIENGQSKGTPRFATGYLGAKRKALVEKHGYDVKNAAHLIRLLRMGEEFLLTGRLNVWREDRDQLIEIKRGEWPLELVASEARRLFAKCREAAEKSPLPATIDMEKVNALTVDVIEKTLWRRKEIG